MRWTSASLRVMKLRHGEVSGVCCLPGSADGHQHISAEGARDTAIPWLPFCTSIGHPECWRRAYNRSPRTGAARQSACPGQSDAIALGPDAEGWSFGARENRILTPVWKAVVGVFGIEFHAGLGWQRAHACHSSRSRLWSDMFLVR